MEQSFAFFKQQACVFRGAHFRWIVISRKFLRGQMLVHSVEAPPDSVAIFEPGDVQHVADFISKRWGGRAHTVLSPLEEEPDETATHDQFCAAQLLPALQGARVLLLEQAGRCALNAGHRGGDPLRLSAIGGSFAACARGFGRSVDARDRCQSPPLVQGPIPGGARASGR